MCSVVELVVDGPHVNTINCIPSCVRQKRDLPVFVVRSSLHEQVCSIFA
jgi:hypothetical protein